MAKELRKTKLPDEIAEMIRDIEYVLEDNGYVGFFSITGGGAHVDYFNYGGTFNVQEGNQWFVRKDVE